MPWELIYTSAPRGLASGQSGFCTVARTNDMREALVQRLEQISSYHYLEFSGPNQPGRNPTISAHRIIDIHGARFHGLTRIAASGLDFTARTNHIAHHLVFSADEVDRLPSPAMILAALGRLEKIVAGGTPPAGPTRGGQLRPDSAPFLARETLA